MNEIAQVQLTKKYVDDPNVPTIFADTIGLIVAADGAMHLEVCATRYVKDEAAGTVTGTVSPVARIAIPMPVALTLHTQIGQHFAEMEKQGSLQRVTVPPPTTPPKH